MSKLLLSVGFILFTGTVTLAEKPLPLPKDLPPIVGEAIAVQTDPNNDINWSIKLTVPKMRWTIVGDRILKKDWPRVETTTESVELILEMSYDEKSALAADSQNRILDMKGNRLNQDEAFKRLGRSQPVLISLSGKKPDPYHLQLTRPDTLIIVPGISDAPAPDLFPQAAKPKKAK